MPPTSSRARRLRGLFAALVAAVLLFVGAVPAWSMTVTFVRHGQSQANADDRIETDIPGRGLSDLGRDQAEAVADALIAAGVPIDAIYTSPLARTRQTAEPLVTRTGLTPTELYGLREIPAGWVEGSPESQGIGRLFYALPAVLWTLGLRFVPVPGSEDGNAFDARVDEALRRIHADSGGDPDFHAVAYGHGATIMFWTLMNVENPDLGLLLHILDNTETVVIEGSPEEGWRLVSWAGIEVSPTPSLPNRLFVRVRDLLVAPQTAIYHVVQALQTGDLAAIANAIRDGVFDVVDTAIRFVPNVIGDIVDAVRPGVAPLTGQSVTTAGRAVAAEPAEAPAAEVGELPAQAGRSEPTALLRRAAREWSGKANGATDLSDGNKVVPLRRGKAPAATAPAPEASLPAEESEPTGPEPGAEPSAAPEHPGPAETGPDPAPADAAGGAERAAA